MDDKTQNDQNWEEMAPGRKVKRDVDGKIVAHKLDPETAREMSQGRTRNKATRHQADVDQLLIEAGYDPPESAPQHLKNLAQMATSGRSGAVSAITRFIAETRKDRPVEEETQLQPGDICPRCKQFFGELDGAVLLQVLAALEGGWQPAEEGDQGSSEALPLN